MKLATSRKIHYESGPNMTPLVDVVMVILIFLMLTGNFGAAEHYLVSNLPITQGGVGQVIAASGIEKTVALDIRVDCPTPERFVATAGRIQTSDPDRLRAQLAGMKKALNDAGTATDDIQVKISPGKNVKYKYLVNVYEAALRAELTKVAFASSH